MRSNDLLIELKYKANGEGLEGINFIEDNTVKAGKYMLCGGVLNKDGGRLFFKARNIEEANEFTKKNPLTTKIIMCS
ncbi:MAG: hypothetical protein RR891_11320 [Clostridium sp.]|uniref:hypothetical protein n=1 Tax=Clostridium sp. TaxID=1506 RepID=UPI00303CEE93